MMWCLFFLVCKSEVHDFLHIKIFAGNPHCGTNNNNLSEKSLKLKHLNLNINRLFVKLRSNIRVALSKENVSKIKYKYTPDKLNNLFYAQYFIQLILIIM